MRADRLVAVVLLLQARGRMTAPQLAEELEVSERTVRRDLEALCVAGVPLVSQRGHRGGWELLGGARLDLTGLTGEEAEALFTVAAPGALAGLAAAGTGLDAGVAAALRKVLVAMPAPLRERVESARGAVLVDPAGWGRAPAAAPAHLEELRRAVLGGEQVELHYARPGRAPEPRRVHPLGLVCKRGTWYLVGAAAAGVRTYRVSRVAAVEGTGLPVERPEGFDLATTWAEIEGHLGYRHGTGVVVDLTVSARAAGLLRAVLGSWAALEEPDPVGAPGRLRVTLPHAAGAARELAAFGDEVDVHGPPEVRAELARIGAALVDRYGGP